MNQTSLRWKLVGSGPFEKLKQGIRDYFGGTDVLFTEVSPDSFTLSNSRGLMDGFRVIKRGKRYRFEVYIPV